MTVWTTPLSKDLVTGHCESANYTGAGNKVFSLQSIILLRSKFLPLVSTSNNIQCGAICKNLSS